MEGLLLPLLLMLVVAVPLVLGTRKQKKQAQQQQTLQNSLVNGDRVMTTSGLYATVTDASDDATIDLEISEGVVTTWLRQAVREKVHADGDAGPDEDTADNDAADQDAQELEEASTTDSSREDEVTAASLEKEKK